MEVSVNKQCHDFLIAAAALVLSVPPEWANPLQLIS